VHKIKNKIKENMNFPQVLLTALEIMPCNWEGMFIETSFVLILKRTSGCQRDA
jgi:hypothetical protein